MFLKVELSDSILNIISSVILVGNLAVIGALKRMANYYMILLALMILIMIGIYIKVSFRFLGGNDENISNWI
ncbi:MAG: hypothetical protein KHX14_09100 [[Clostridium] spiroforme]|uniref:Uncharacterized protein n=1 Tax=Thomasclavelia spiroformis TaxID=29348 RepID=A0A943EM59_9FIRM|nr:MULTISPECIES: hypothetical protein [Thomasclavelia]MBS5588946.1 hypothetical protein [Thomasclavelia spiroformis]